MTDRYAVFGNPIAHSKSPLIHRLFARETGQDLAYEAILAPLDGFADALRNFIDGGGKGANVTVPFKLEAFALARPSARARIAGAVNTLSFADGEIRGDNTDGAGLVADIRRNLGYDFSGKRVLLVGAGGAARGVLSPLLEAFPAQLTIANRSPAKARELTEVAQPIAQTGGCAIAAQDFSALAGQKFDLVINSTSSGLSDAYPEGLPQDLFAEQALAYDMMYGRETPFLRIAREQGARTADGLGMLVEQAAEAFFIWRGVRPSTAPVIAQLRT